MTQAQKDRPREEKLGWYARLCRKALEAEWNRMSEELGPIVREQARSDAWDRINRNGGIPLTELPKLARALMDQKEQQILAANQSMFSNALRDAKREIEDKDLEPKLPFLDEDEYARERVQEILSENFARVEGHYLRDPDSDYKNVKRAEDVDFFVAFRMTQVRDEASQKLLLSTENYEWLENVRQSLGLSRSTKISDLIANGSESRGEQAS